MSTTYTALVGKSSTRWQVRCPDCGFSKKYPNRADASSHQRRHACQNCDRMLGVSPVREVATDGGIEVVEDNWGSPAPAEVDGVNLKQDGCPVCGTEAFDEFPAGHYHCATCRSGWGGDPENASIETYFGPSAEDLAETGASLPVDIDGKCAACFVRPTVPDSRHCSGCHDALIADGGVAEMPEDHVAYWAAQVQAFLDEYEYEDVSVTERYNAADLVLTIPTDSLLRRRRNREVFITELETAGFDVLTTGEQLIYVNAPEDSRLDTDLDPEWQEATTTDDDHVRTSDADLAAHNHANGLEAALDHIFEAVLRAEDESVGDALVARLKLAVCGARLAFYATSDEERAVGVHDATEHLETVEEAVEDETVAERVHRALQLLAGSEDGDAEC